MKKWMMTYVLVAGMVPGLLHAQIVTNIWLGISDTSASTGANWSANRVPVASDHIVLDERSGNAPLVWDATPANGLTQTVASWTQTNYTGSVQFDTTYDAAGFPLFTVGGDAHVMSGAWTHRQNDKTDTYRLAVHARGHFVLGRNASVSLSGKGRRKSGYGYYGAAGGSAHAGEATLRNAPFLNHKSYGAVTRPTHLGSGNDHSTAYTGAGAVVLTVDGVLTLDGTLNANGVNTGYGSGGTSGGSVWITAASMTGSGIITSNGGNDGGGTYGNASGGRIALYVTDPEQEVPATLLANMSNWGVKGNGNATPGAAGTTYLQNGGVATGCGLVLVDSPVQSRDPLYTHLPAHDPASREALDNTAWTLKRKARLKILEDAEIRSLTLEGAQTLLNLNDCILVVSGVVEINGTVLPPGVYTAQDHAQIEGAGHLSVAGMAVLDNGLLDLDASENTVTMSVDVRFEGLAPATLYLCYGTTNGGTSLDAWDVVEAVASPLASGVHSATILIPGPLFYYRFAASNETGVVWAPEPLPVRMVSVNASASAPLASKSPFSPGMVTFTIPAPVDEELTLFYAVSGTAIAGLDTAVEVDYAALSGHVTLPAGQMSVNVEITPAGRWRLYNTDVTVTLKAGAYVIGASPNATVLIKGTPVPPQYNAWLGGLQTDTTSWSKGALPSADDHVLLSGWAMAQELNWNGLTNKLAAYTQTEAFRGGVVKLNTTFPDVDSAQAWLDVPGDVVINGGTLSVLAQSGASARQFRLAVKAGGDMLIGANGVVSATTKGYLARSGPGWLNNTAPAAHAGIPSSSGVVNAKTYGSFAHPDEPGSGSDRYAGGGMVCLEVQGSLVVNGVICAGGGDESSNSGGGGSGGSILIHANEITGSGALSATGGTDGHSGNGAGGRIAVVANEIGDSIYNAMSALGGTAASSYRAVGAAGTIYTKRPGEETGTLVIRSQSSPSGGGAQPVTHLPAMSGFGDDLGTLRKTSLALESFARAELTQNVYVDNVTLRASNASLLLNGHTLTTWQYTRPDGTVFKKAGTYTEVDGAEHFPGVVFGGGSVTIQYGGTLWLIK